MRQRIFLLAIISVIAFAVTMLANYKPWQQADPSLISNSPSTGKSPGAKKNASKKKPTLPGEHLNPHKDVIKATSRDMAQLLAKADSGRADPMSPISSSRPFPRANKQATDPDLLPPPPDSEKFDTGSDLVPPPPSFSQADLPPEPPGIMDSIPSQDLPPPPADQSLIKMLSLNAILGNQVILSLSDRSYRKQHGFKEYITLAKGESFDGVKLISINGETAIIEEEGRTQSLCLPSIR